MSIFFLAIFLLLVASAYYLSLRYCENRSLQLFRVLFPSWRFFEDIAAVPVLHYRCENSSGEFSAWREALRRPQREMLGIFCNPQTNLYHACQSLLQHLESDIGDCQTEQEIGTFADSVSYLLTRHLVASLIRQEHSELQAKRFQFKVTRAVGNDENRTIETFLVSHTHEV